MTNKPTDAEIIKALECCQTWDIADCKKCPNRNSGNDCIKEVKRNALDLINSLKAENEALISGQETLQTHIAETEKKYALAVAEREANVKGFTETINKIKAEAIKEFAERLNSKCDAPHWCVWMSDISELLEEMVGDMGV